MEALYISISFVYRTMLTTPLLYIYSLLADTVCFVIEVAVQPDFYVGASQNQSHPCIERENRNCKYASNPKKTLFYKMVLLLLQSDCYHRNCLFYLTLSEAIPPVKWTIWPVNYSSQAMISRSFLTWLSP